jgi:hypothetical protein
MTDGDKTLHDSDAHCVHAPSGWNEDVDGEYDDDCVHCDCCCTCLGCEYGPQDGMLMYPDGAPWATSETD